MPADGSSPFDRAGFVDSITFGYGLPLMRIGAKQTLQAADLPAIGAQDRAACAVERILAAWLVEQGQGSAGASLWRALYRAFRRRFWVAAAWAFLESCCRLAQPILLRSILHALAQSQVEELYACAVGLVLVSFLQAVVHHQLFFTTMTGAWQIRIGLAGVLHWKLLRLQTAVLQSEKTADCYNLVANDIQRFDAFLPMAHFAWTAFLDLAVVVLASVLLVGWAASAVGIVVVLGSIAIMVFFGKRFARRRKITAAITDERLKVTSEVIAAVLSVKVYCWEDAFIERISGIRKREHASIFRRQQMVATASAISFSLVPAASLFLFLTFIAQGEALTLEAVYTVLSLFMVLRISFGKHFKNVMQFGPECHAAVVRMRRFLLQPQVPLRPMVPLEGLSCPVVDVRGASYLWPSNGAQALTEVSARLRKGELLVVAGPVGCGKSALLQALIGELHLSCGSATLRGAVAYAPQAPWIMAGTLRSNITMGSCASEEWYDEVLTACSLKADVQQLGPAGDGTEIGERGVNLSGGQKARVGLARAVFARADVVLLDDPLSAVDPSVSGQLVDKCIKGKVLADAGVVLCTHQASVFSLADALLLLDENGGVRAYGKPHEVAETCGLTLEAAVPSSEASAGEVGVGGQGPPASEGEKADRPVAGETRLVKAEDNAKGSVAWGTYLAFARIAGLKLTVAVLWLFVLSQGALLASNYWLGLWAEAKDQAQAHYAVIFSAITGATVLLAVARSVLFYFTALRASSSLHNLALRHVLGTRLGFFSANPQGRVLNRFSGDVGNVDELLSQTLHEVFDLGGIGVGALTLICISVPFAIPFLFAMLWYMLHLRRFVVKSMTELKRLDSVSRSPVFDCYAATMRGLVCLRAFRLEEAAQERMLDLLEANAKAWFWWLITNRFLGFRLDMQTVLVMVFAAVGGAAVRDFVGPEFIGLAIVHAISLSGLFQFMVRQSALAESYMTSFQRLQTYAALPYEPDDGSHKPTNPFPMKGTIVFSGLCMRYRDDLPLVLKGVDFACPGGIKVGICGRTGSGKSSIFMALARLAETKAGHITVDGVDVASLPLRTLRMCIAWVPQEPSFFTGTLRSNLDPFQQHGDGEVWEALRAVEMADALGCEGLQLQMAEEGSNFSAGERQLLSLSRSLLQRRRVLCMDEAFANVDFATDAKVQKAIRVATQGLGVTVLVIAHRLQTLADAGYVVVMSAGTVEEHGPPAELLQKNGAYAEMVRQSGLDVRAAHALASAGGLGATAPATTFAAPVELCAAPSGDTKPKQRLESDCVSPALLACAPQLRWAAQSGKGDGASGPACIPWR